MPSCSMAAARKVSAESSSSQSIGLFPNVCASVSKNFMNGQTLAVKGNSRIDFINTALQPSAAPPQPKETTADYADNTDGAEVQRQSSKHFATDEHRFTQ